MAGAAAPASAAGAKWNDSIALVSAWGGCEQLGRVCGALRASLADAALPPLPQEVCALVADMSWAQVADTLRLAESSQWRSGLTVPKSAMGHMIMWLLVGSDSPYPLQLHSADAASL